MTDFELESLRVEFDLYVIQHIKYSKPYHVISCHNLQFWMLDALRCLRLSERQNGKLQFRRESGCQKLMQASLGICISLKATNHVIRWEDVAESSGTSGGGI
ncbi:hypothetical protein SADUNF_Sadunf13G0027500 [Salix dunnii]|uniref:Uncharacterized protein n=1 Tax=Salix dunnii TaxID=1413687 RepID=A0A835JKD9_9ROSI|nr:hypothetical protein SADUNF_Sadunf13G0027500 [Salix dunnii]